jgi:hypothetical protein
MKGLKASQAVVSMGSFASIGSDTRFSAATGVRGVPPSTADPPSAKGTNCGGLAVELSLELVARGAAPAPGGDE